MSSEVNVTGIGIVSPAGLTAETTWRALLAGRRCIAPVAELSAQLDQSRIKTHYDKFLQVIVKYIF